MGEVRVKEESEGIGQSVQRASFDPRTRRYLKGGHNLVSECALKLTCELARSGTVVGRGTQAIDGVDENCPPALKPARHRHSVPP